MKHIRKLTSWLLTIALIFALLPVVAIRARAALSGDGSEGTPYQIYNSDDLKAFRDIVNGGDFDAYAELKDNIELNENEEWTPIGKLATGYTGTFDGKDHSITGLKVNGDNYCGLFKIIEEGGKVQNVIVSGNVTGSVNVPGSGYFVGGVVGANYGTVENCSNACTVNGSGYVGGVMGYNSGTVTNCYNTGSVTGNSDVGGVAGFNCSDCSDGTVTNSYNTGAVNGETKVGGVVGYNGGTVTNCYYRTYPELSGIGDGTGTATPVTNLAIAVTWSELHDVLQIDGCVVALGADVTYGTGDGHLDVPVDTTVNLDLTGHVIDRGLKNAASVNSGFVITVSGNLTITDSSTRKTGKITGGNTSSSGGGVFISSYGSFTLKGGTIGGNTAGYDGGGVYIETDGSFTLEDGTISSNTASFGGGVNIYGTFTQKGGTISGNIAGNGGGVYIYSGGIFILEGGTISGNTTNYGGGVYIYAGGSFNQKGGTISGNTASTNGGGVFCDGTFNLSGSATISDNHKGTNPTAADYNNVYLETDKIITITGALKNTTPIGVTMHTPGTITSELSTIVSGTTYGTAANFTSDNAAYGVALNASKKAYLGTRENKPTAIFTATGAESGELSNLTENATYTLSGAGLTATDITADTNGRYKIASGLTADTLSIVKKGDGSTTADSVAQTIEIDKASVPTGLAKTDCTTSANTDGTITGVTTEMEYKKSDAVSWTDGTGSDITGLTPGTYYVRVKASGTTLASDNQTVTIKKKPSGSGSGPGPSYSYYTVKYEMNGHGEQVSSQTIRSGLKAKRPQDPTAEEYYFAGWFEDVELTKEYDFSSPVRKSMTLYARWEEIRFTVSFDLDGKGSIETQWVRKNGMAEKPDDPSAEGFTFGGWYEDSDCTNLYDFSTPVTKDITLYAKWVKNVPIYRLYNPNSGAHLFTSNAAEKDNLVLIGWEYEGIAWTAPASSNIPVYRLYNPNSGEHHYTKDAAEKDILVTLGWNYEGISWYSDENQGTPLYRLYNPNATGQYAAGAHHYTKDVEERDYLIVAGWNDEGIGWYGI